MRARFLRLGQNALSIVVLSVWGASVLGLRALSERAGERPEEKLFQKALKYGSDTALLVRTHPELARARIHDLWARAFDARIAGKQPAAQFGEARRLAQLLAENFRDASFLQATAYYERLGESEVSEKREADRLWREAESAYRGGDYGKARSDAEAARVIYERLGDPWGGLRTLLLLGNIQWLSGEREEAEAIYQGLQKSARALGDWEREAAAMNNLAVLDEMRGRLREAASAYRAVQALSEEHGLGRITAMALLYRGILYHRLGLYERAVPVFARAEEVVRGLGERRLEAVLASNRGASLHRMGRKEEALTAYHRSLNLRSREVDPSRRVPTLLHVAELLNELGRSEEALGTLGEILARTRESEDVESRRVRWGALVTQGDIHCVERRWEMARRAYEQAASIAAEVGDSLDRIETVRRRGQLLEAEGRPEEGARELETAVQLVEALRASPEVEEERIQFLSTQESIYESLAGIYLRGLRQPLKAWELLERTRSRALLDSLQAGAFASPDGAGGWQVTLRSSADPEPLERVLSHLPEDGLLLQYATAKRWLALLTFDRRGLCCWRVEDVEESVLSRSVSELAAWAGRPPSPGAAEEGVQALERLSGLLLEPASDALKESRHLVIVPDGHLFQIPWAALRWRGHYLVERFDLAIEPGASAFVRLTDRAPRPRAPSALIVANPQADVRDGSFARSAPASGVRSLTEAETEGRAIATLFPRSRLLVGGEATESALRLEIGRHGLIHFATHARIEPDRPLYSSLLLSGGSGAIEDLGLHPVGTADGALTGYETLGLALSPGALITLASCESAGGLQSGGEGVVGLARAFLEAGAGAVLGSLWPVEDRATRELMVRFYQELTAPGASTAQALARAQSAMARGEGGQTRRHPFFWAGFLLIGDGR